MQTKHELTWAVYYDESARSPARRCSCAACIRSRAAVDTGTTLFCYMTFRAQREGVEHQFTSKFYGEAIQKGIRLFFGIEVTADGAILADAQNPAALEAWCVVGRGWVPNPQQPKEGT